MENTIRYKPEVESVPQTGSTNNLTTKTDINTISLAIPMFWGNLTLRFLYPEISRWRTYTGSSYNFATERYEDDLSGCNNVSCHFHRYRHCSTSDNSIRCKPEVETVPNTGNTNKLETKTDVDAIVVTIQA